MKKFTISPILRSIRDMHGPKTHFIQEWAEEFVYDVLCAPRRIKYWFREKFTKMKVKVPELHGGWYDTDTKLLYVNFQLLVNFMENEVAHMWDICLANYEPAKDLKPKTPREKAIAYYTWTEDMSKMSAQEKKHYKAQKAWENKVVDLYIWWKDKRPDRKNHDKWDALVAWEKETGYENCHFEPCPDSNCSQMIFHDSHPLYPKYRELCHAAVKQDEDWDKEDTQKLIQLIKLRKHLWT